MIIYSKEVEEMCTVAQGVHHGCAPIPEEAKWVQAKKVEDISGLTHGVGWCAPQQGACKLTLNVKEGIIQEALVETLGCSGMTHSAAMASEILPGLTVMEALNTDLVCDQHSHERTVLTDRIWPFSECILRKRAACRRRSGRSRQGLKKPGRYHVRHLKERPSLSGNGRRLCDRYCTGCGR